MSARVTISHGGGGSLTRDLVLDLFVSRFGAPEGPGLADSALLPQIIGSAAFTTDTFVVKPLFFRGGDIGRLAVCGTVNDLAVCGAKPLFLSAGFVIEEGFPVADLERIAISMANTAAEAGVKIVTGDTKVVERGCADGLFINTSGIGSIPPGLAVGADRIRPADRVIVSGTLGDHGVAVMSERAGISFLTTVVSDVAPLQDLIAAALSAGGIHAMRDPTRGGAAAALNELACAGSVGVLLEESAVPVREPVRSACGLLGLDPMTIANEGKVILFVHPDSAEEVLRALRTHPLGAEAADIGVAVEARPGVVAMKTPVGGTRVVDMPLGEGLPRIC